ncbi:MAG: tRNA-dihydrouridine synthase family protein [Planctomycetota bacterium]
MSCETASRNATPPTPAIAPGAEAIDPAEVARTHETDPRLAGAVPGFDAPFFQAGLAGYSDAAMRIVARRHGCPCCVTEALLDRALLGGGRGFDKADLGSVADNVPGGDEDHPLIGQIMGSDPGEMAAAGVKMIEQGARRTRIYRAFAEDADRRARAAHEVTAAVRTFAAIDVNLACPVKKVKRKARGGHWLADPDGAIELLRAVREALPPEIPTTVKLRRGSDDSPEAEANFRRVFEAVYELGYAWAVVHARTVAQKYVGPSRWTFLRDLCARYPDRPILGSGDVWTAPDIFRMVRFTGVSAVSVARGCIGNPWIFRQARQMMAGEAPAAPTIGEQREVLEQHFELSVAVNGERAASLMMRKFGIRFAAHHPEAERVRRAFIAVDSIDAWRAVLDQAYTEPALATA